MGQFDPWNDEDDEKDAAYEAEAAAEQPIDAPAPVAPKSELDTFLEKYQATAGDESAIKKAEDTAKSNNMWTSLAEGLSTAFAGRNKTDSGYYASLRARNDAAVDTARGDKKSKLADLWQQYQAKRQGKQDARDEEKWGLEKPELEQKNQERKDLSDPKSSTSQAASMAAISKVDQTIAEAAKVGADTSVLKAFRERLSKNELSARDIKEAGALGDYKDLLNNQAAMARIVAQGNQAREAADRADAAEKRREKNRSDKRIADLRASINRDPSAKAALDLDSRVERMQRLATLNSSQGDEALLMQWEKTLDPNSVVMPSEFQRSLEAQGIPALIARARGRLDGSGRMRPEDRAQFIKATQILREQSRGQAQGALRPYLLDADRDQIDHNLLISPFYQDVAAGNAPGTTPVTGPAPASPAPTAPAPEMTPEEAAAVKAYKAQYPDKTDAQILKAIRNQKAK